jgi:hypothetical protein
MFEFTLNSLPQFGQGHRNAEKAMSKEKKKKKKVEKDLTCSSSVRIDMDPQAAWTIEAFEASRTDMLLASTISRMVVVTRIFSRTGFR